MKDNEIIKAWEKILATGDAPVGEHWSVGAVVTSKLAKETFDMLNRQKAENERLNKIVEKYAASARTISLRLSAFCNTNLPYDEMIADASRKASEEIERLRNESFCFANERDAYKNILDTAVTEAIKEFAERLKKMFHISCDYTCNYVRATIDDLVKEMVGDSDA